MYTYLFKLFKKYFSIVAFIIRYVNLGMYEVLGKIISPHTVTLRQFHFSRSFFALSFRSNLVYHSEFRYVENIILKRVYLLFSFSRKCQYYI